MTMSATEATDSTLTMAAAVPKPSLRPSKYTSSIRTSMDEAAQEADKTLFGTMKDDITDQLAACIYTGLADGVSTLPCLDTEKQQTMKTLLQKTFMKNVDGVEIFSKRNIFTMRHCTPKRVADVVGIFEALPEGTIPDAVEIPKVTSGEGVNDQATVQRDMPSSTDIPTKEQLDKLKQDIVAMRQQYAQLSLQRASLERENESWDAAQNLSSLASDALDDVLVNPQQQVVHPVARVVEQQVPELIQSIHDGQELLEELSTNASQSANGDTDPGIYLLGQYKKQKTTLAERIETATEMCTDENKARKLLALITGPADPAAKPTYSMTTPFRMNRPRDT